jgi:hypothetical protein
MRSLVSRRLSAFAGIAFVISTVVAEPTEAQSTAIRFVDDLPVVQVTLHAGENRYPCHLLIDLTRGEALHLHRNAAQALGALECDVVAGDVVLKDLPIEGSRDRWLEGFTARNAEVLREIPLAGYLGISAFGSALVTLDGPGARLELGSSEAALSRPPEADHRAVLDLLPGSEDHGPLFRATLDGATSLRFGLDSRVGHSVVDADAVGDRLVDHCKLPQLRLGALEIGPAIAFRTATSEGEFDGRLGGRILRQVRIRLAPSTADPWIAFELAAPLSIPTEEFALAAALAAEDPLPALDEFLRAHPSGRFALEAARARLPLAMRADTDDESRLGAARAAIEAAPTKARAREALDILGKLENSPRTAALRDGIAAIGIGFAKDDEDGTAIHRLQVEAGRLALARGETVTSKRHLLSAVFGLPGDGPANLALGQLHEQAGELERAQSRYLLAMLDTKQTAEEGYLALEALHPRLAGKTRTLVDVLAELAEGRVPALHPIPREPEEIRKSGHVVLAELFTGAMCPPCVAADVAFDALGEHFGTDEIALIAWHLPIPAPEPMVAPVAEERAKRRNVRGTPTLVVDGIETIVGGGKAEQAGEMFAKYVAAVTPRASTVEPIELSARTMRDGSRWTVEVDGKAPPGSRVHAILVERRLVYPGRNGVLFHQHVARARFTPSEGATPDSGSPLWSGSLDLTTVARALDARIAEFETRREFAVRPTVPDPGSLDVIVFLEDSATGAVLQAAHARPGT